MKGLSLFVKKSLELLFESCNVSKLPVHRSEANVRHFIDRSELLHHELTYVPAGHFWFKSVAQSPLDVGHCRFEIGDSRRRFSHALMMPARILFTNSSLLPSFLTTMRGVLSTTSYVMNLRPQLVLATPAHRAAVISRRRVRDLRIMLGAERAPHLRHFHTIIKEGRRLCAAFARSLKGRNRSVLFLVEVVDTTVWRLRRTSLCGAGDHNVLAPPEQPKAGPLPATSA